MALATADYSWTFEPGAAVLLVGMSVLYGTRWRAVRASPEGARGAPVGSAIAFAGAVLVAFVALFSPVDVLGEQLFAMHMVQHVLLLDVVPILLMLSLTKILLRPATRRLQRVERAAGPLAHPALAVVLYVGIMWIWHVPTMYDAALEHPVVHVAEHVCFLSVGVLYWWHLLSPIRSRISIGPFGPVVYMLVTKLLVGMLGIGITFAPSSIYDFYERVARVWGLSVTDDQALAGAIMAIEQSVVMGIALAYLFVKALAESDRADERDERFGRA
ncbi:MAG: cytochrome c oxidase assembly protein [Solirubrobacterales bacterium]|nr:cytochrome c oxidase assembly protein [Solirubrobacterales bacterium]